ncbi:MAG: DUF2304 domain-containing protein [Bulleidia sp.]|nr:DUF2304 domain-containing protein [Bulleidia sp.]
MVSMPIGLRVALIAGSLLVLIYVTVSSVRSKMNVRYAIMWVTWSAVILIMGIWPELALHLAQAIGFQTVSNFVFVFTIGMLFLFNYYAYLKMSHLNSDVRKLNYEVAELRKELHDLKEGKKDEQ